MKLHFLNFDIRNFAMKHRVYSFVPFANWIESLIIFREETARFYQRRMRSQPVAPKESFGNLSIAPTDNLG